MKMGKIVGMGLLVGAALTVVIPEYVPPRPFLAVLLGSLPWRIHTDQIIVPSINLSEEFRPSMLQPKSPFIPTKRLRSNPHQDWRAYTPPWSFLRPASLLLTSTRPNPYRPRGTMTTTMMTMMMMTMTMRRTITTPSFVTAQTPRTLSGPLFL